MYQRFAKRLLDLGLTILVTVLISPILLVIAILVRARMGSPVLFRQLRPGRDGKPFEILKFRTMTGERDATGALLSDEERLNDFGRLLRRTSLDELPELFNVLRGDMSLIGPRPLLMVYLERYSPRQMRRHEVKPGISGWAQINGRNALTWEDKFELDVWYVDHLSFSLDMKILLLTIWKTLRQEGINQPGHATMEEFHGSSRSKAS